MGDTGSGRSRWVRAAFGSRRTLALLGVALLALASVGIGAAVVRQAHAATVTVCPTAPIGCTYSSVATAVAAAATGDTVTVAAGTYHETSQIVITHPLTLQGAGAATTIIQSPMFGSGNILINPSAAGPTTISGFTIEGNGTNGNCTTSGVRPLLIVNKDRTAGDIVTITNNTIAESLALDCFQPADFSIAIYNEGATATTTMSTLNVTDNDFTGLWQAVLSEDAAGPLTVSGNTIENLQANTNVAGGYSANQIPEAVFDFAHNPGSTTPFSVTSPQVFTNNTFKNFPSGGLGIGIFGGFNSTGLGPGGADAGPGIVSNVTISGNTFAYTTSTLSGNLNNKPYGVLVETDDAGSQVSTIAIDGNTFHISGPMAGFKALNAITGATFANNVMFGSSPMPAGVLLQPGGSTTLALSGNLITGFSTGISSAVLTTTGVTASQNCIYGNATGAAVTTGGNALTATNNWWGATNGPLPSGSGNAATGNITVSPFLTTAAAICSPVTTLSVGQPSAISGGANYVSSTTPISLSSVVAPATGSTIAHVYYRFYPQATTPPAFTSVAGHSASFMLSGANGTYTVQDYAVDAAGNVEATHTTTLVLTTLVPGLDVAGSSSGTAPNTGSPDTGYQAPANSDNPVIGATGQTGARGATSPASKAVSKPTLAWLPWWAYTGIGVLLLLVVVGGATFLLLRSHTSRQQA